MVTDYKNSNSNFYVDCDLQVGTIDWFYIHVNVQWIVVNNKLPEFTYYIEKQDIVNNALI